MYIYTILYIDVEVKAAVNELYGIASKWRLLGIQFGFENTELDGIKMSHNNDPVTCLIEVFSRRKTRNTPIRWGTIVAALHAMQQSKLAYRISRKYSVPKSPLNPGNYRDLAVCPNVVGPPSLYYMREHSLYQNSCICIIEKT